MRALLLCSALLALAACHTLAPLPATPWAERRAVLQAVEKFEVNGQLAVATSSEGFSANLRWQQQGLRAICCCARRSEWAART